jgi:deoxyribodipyrimidine photolyase
MQRAQRAFENLALELAIRAANELRVPAVVFFGLLTTHPVANLRHCTFMVEGLSDTAARLKRRGIGFAVRAVSRDGPARTFQQFCADANAAMAVMDENPLRHSARWREDAARVLRIPLLSVDADVIVPVVLLQREQYAARTIRSEDSCIFAALSEAGKKHRADNPLEILGATGVASTLDEPAQTGESRSFRAGCAGGSRRHFGRAAKTAGFHGTRA